MNKSTVTMSQHRPTEPTASKHDPNTMIPTAAASGMQNLSPPCYLQQCLPISLTQQHQNMSKPPCIDAPTMDHIKLPKCLPHKTPITTQQDCNTLPTSHKMRPQQAMHMMTTMMAAVDQMLTLKIPYDRKEFPRPLDTGHDSSN